VLENLQAAAQLRHPTNVVEAILGSGRLRRATSAIDTAAAELLALIGLAAAAGRRGRRPCPMATSAGSSWPGRSPPAPAC